MINITRKPCLTLTICISIIVTIFLLTRHRTGLSTDHPTEPKLSLPNEITISGYKETNVEIKEKQNACFVVLIRNSELRDFKRTMMQLEDRFNKKFNYPYVFLNDKEFTEDFKQQLRALSNSTLEFGVIPKKHWSIPDFIDKEKAKKSWERMASAGIPYGGSESYRHMCRFESGFFFQHELTLKYDYYWRVEPGVEFLCDIPFDPFTYMKENDKLYGFTIAPYEFMNTIETLWSTTKSWVASNNIELPEDNALGFVSDNGGLSYNRCHFWTNFEIASFSLWRNRQYMSYFEHLDRAGGFFYERWGDAPVHSIYASLTLNKSQIHFFNEIGYNHPPNMHCPSQEKYRKLCFCSGEDNFDMSHNSCASRWFNINQLKYEED